MPRRPSVLVIAAASVAMLGSVLAGCTSSGGSAGGPAAQAGRPVVGSCHTYDSVAAEAPTEDGPVVKCSAKHTAETLAVLDSLPVPNADGTWTDDQLSIAGQTVCGNSAISEKLGRTARQLATTRISRAFFAPTAKQAKAGARWVRCDVLVLDRGDPVLISGSLVGQVDVNGAFARCTKQPPVAENEAVRCRSGQGLYAAVGAVPLPADAPAADAAFQTALTKACQRAFPSASEGADAWVATAPDQTQQQGATPTDASCWLPVTQWNVDSSRWPAETPLRRTTQV